MKNACRWWKAVAMMAGLAATALAQYDPNVRVRPPYVPGELLVVLAENPNAASIPGRTPDDLFAAIGATVTNTLVFNPGENYYHLRFAPTVPLGQAFRRIQTFEFAPRWSLKRIDTNGLSFPAVVGGTPPGGGRVFNLSARAEVRTGESVTIGGLVVPGEFPRFVAFRLLGPSLKQFGISNPLNNPKLQLFQGNNEILQNDDWVTLREWERDQARALCGGTPADMKESLLMTLLDPGAYTGIVSGVDGETGVALLEIYILDHFYVY